MHEITAQGVRNLVFNPQQFDYATTQIDPQAAQGLGYAGFRATTALNLPGYRDEFVSFLGASYFRALGKGQLYGISARGLAIDTAQASGEEFPRFVEFAVHGRGLRTVREEGAQGVSDLRKPRCARYDGKVRPPLASNAESATPRLRATLRKPEWRSKAGGRATGTGRWSTWLR
jgi:hypothetical protein